MSAAAGMCATMSTLAICAGGRAARSRPCRRSRHRIARVADELDDASARHVALMRTVEVGVIVSVSTLSSHRRG